MGWFLFKVWLLINEEVLVVRGLEERNFEELFFCGGLSLIFIWFFRGFVEIFWMLYWLWVEDWEFLDEWMVGGCGVVGELIGM